MKNISIFLSFNSLKRCPKVKNPDFFPVHLLFSIFLLICFPVLASQTDEESSSVPVMVGEAAQSLVRITVPFEAETTAARQKKMVSDIYFSIGTGFLIDEKTVITNFHIIQYFKSEMRLFITSQTDDPLLFKRITHLSAMDDLAVLEIENYKEPFLKLGTLPSNFKLIPLCTLWAAFQLTILCDDNYILGFHQENFNTITGKLINNNFLGQNNISVINDIKMMDLSGMSGGPMVNDQGESLC